MAEVVIADQDAKQPCGADCPSCGQPTRNKGQKGLEVESQVGLLSVIEGITIALAATAGFLPWMSN